MDVVGVGMGVGGEELVDEEGLEWGGGDEEDGEMVGREFVDMLVMYEIEGEIFLELVEDYLMGSGE